MKKTLLVNLICILISHQTLAEEVPGTQFLNSYRSGISFINRDSHNRLWIGYGGVNWNGARLNNGLRYLDSQNVEKIVFNNGSFTDAIEWKGKTYITAIDGLYEYDRDSLTRYSTMYNSNCIAEFNDSLVIGSTGYGLYFWKNNHFNIKRININNRYYDTIYDVAVEGKKLWIATNSGLIKYEFGKYSLVQLPIIKGASNAIQFKITSVAIDGKNRAWFSNASNIDSVPNLYVIENSTIIDAKKWYKLKCETTFWFPKQVFNLQRARNGTILLGTKYGLLELSDQIKTFFVNTFGVSKYMGVEDLTTTTFNYMAIEDVNGNYINANFTGIYSIDRKVYTIEKYSEVVLGKFQRTNRQIDLNDIDANIANDGVFFNGSDLERMVLRRPILRLRSQNSICASLMYGSGLWISGKKDSTYYSSIQTYRAEGSEFVAGPINIKTLEFDSTIVSKYNQIWSVKKSEIDDFLKNRGKAGYQIPSSILEWPGNAEANTYSVMAPYHDIDGNGIYEPIKGDYPKIKGDLMMWWVFNDIVEHKISNSDPMKIQVNASCYAYNDLTKSEGDPDFLVNRTLMFDFKFINLSGVNYDEFVAGTFNDVEIGDYTNDKVGCDSSINTGFGFNASNFDNEYGSNPPIIACKFLNKKMNHFVSTNVGSNMFNVNPWKGVYYHIMNSYSYALGKPVKVANFEYPFLPCQTSTQAIGDKRFLMTSNFGELKNNSSINLEMAYFVQYNPNVDYLKDNCNELKNNANKIQNWYDNNSFPSKSYWSTELTEIILPKIEVYPNPSNAIFTIEANADISKIKVFDVLGNLVIEQNCSQNQATIYLEKLDKGIYILHAVTAYGVVTKKLIKS